MHDHWLTIAYVPRVILEMDIVVPFWDVPINKTFVYLALRLVSNVSNQCGSLARFFAFVYACSKCQSRIVDCLKHVLNRFVLFVTFNAHFISIYLNPR